MSLAPKNWRWHLGNFWPRSLKFLRVAIWLFLAVFRRFLRFLTSKLTQVITFKIGGKWVKTGQNDAKMFGGPFKQFLNAIWALCGPKNLATLLHITLENYLKKELGFGKQFQMFHRSERFRVKLWQTKSCNLMHFGKICNKGPTIDPRVLLEKRTRSWEAILNVSQIGPFWRKIASKKNGT